MNKIALSIAKLHAEVMKTKCTGCEKNLGTPRLHPCPFVADVSNDPSPKCNCCDDCQRRCAEDI